MSYPVNDPIGEMYAADARLRHVFTYIPKMTQVDFACLYAYHRDTHQMKLSALQNNAYITEASYSALLPWIEERLRSDQLTDVLTYEIVLTPTPCDLKSAVIYPLLSENGDILGVLFFFYLRAWQLPQEELNELKHIAIYAQTILQNMSFVTQLVFAQALFNASQEIIKDPTPANVVRVLHNYVFDDHITNCALGLFNPRISEIKKHRNIENVQIVASWSKDFGDGVSVGEHIPIAYFRRFQRELEQGEIITLYNIEPLKTADNIPQGLRDLLIETDVKSLNVLFLTSENQPLGVMFITSDETNTLPAYEMQVYKSISDLLTLSVVVNELKRYVDNVTQGRAAVMDSVEEAVVLVSPDDQRIFAYNQQFTDFLELPHQDDLREMCLWDVLPALRADTKYRTELLGEWQAACNSTETREGEIIIKSKSNKPLIVKWYTAPVYRRNRMVGRIFTFYDLTKEREALMFQHELWMRVSHEFRTPLTSAKGYSQLVLDYNDAELLQDGREKIGIIHDSLKRLNDMLSELLDISKANMGDTILTFTKVNITELAHDVHTRLALQFKEKRQAVVIHAPSDMPIVVCDLRRIDQVVSNLMTNAIKYAPQQSQITVQIFHIHAREQLPKHVPEGVITPCVLVAVLDEGAGISKEDAEKVFVPFYRTEYARKVKAEGVGLGLAICKTFIELHHGKIWVDPTTNKKAGGRFYFTLPIERP